MSEADSRLGLLEAIVDRLPEFVHVIDEQGRYLYINKAMGDALAVRPDEVVGRRVIDVFPGAPNNERVLREVQQVLTTGRDLRIDEVEVHDPDGRPRIIRNERHALRTDLLGVQAVLTISRDVTDLKRAEQALRKRAMYDALTGLPNRPTFDERLRHALRGLRRRDAGQIGLLFVDLDSFKQINDTLGHAAGDRLLIEAARRFEGALRPGDTVARFGGDEFAMILMSVGAEEVETVCARLHAALAEPFELDDWLRKMSCSVGAVLASSPDADPDELVRRADAAMYSAKGDGHGLTRFWSPTTDQAGDESG